MAHALAGLAAMAKAGLWRGLLKFARKAHALAQLAKWHGLVMRHGTR
ncbi:hypothetical protein H1230_07645 [Paenibacillus sp. 19GGS1-52]|nr:hypothetical protein [Paenibacillus sp. 19GGS1-52]ULO08659.1 hypothetical protein H1230_07645 [Paenibacillus sp. 19GGS1-52]